MLKALTLGAATVLTSTALHAQNRIDTQRPDAPELAAYGEHAVGVRTITLTHADQIDILNVTSDAQPRYDRELVVEVWYPAATDATGDTALTAIQRDTTEVTLQGRAMRDAQATTDGPYPLVIISHGYPGNRHLMSHLGENIASKGYVVASIDHRDSTYSDQAAFGSTLYNRAIDQHFVLDTMADSAEFAGLVNADQTAIIGYSMGGYGALISGGAGVTQTSVDYSWGTPAGLLGRHLAGSDSHEALMDDRLQAIIAIGPWGRQLQFWDEAGLSGLRVPAMIVGGSVDDVSDYTNGIRPIWEQATGTTRHLLTFDNANHNAAAPMPAPVESYATNEDLGFAPFEHYADAVWDNVRMNNILQHFATAFLDVHLKGDTDKAAYLDLIPVAADGVTALDDAGAQTDDHTYWIGFPARTAAGLRFETLAAE